MIARIRRELPASRAWFGIAYGSVDTDAAAVQLGLDASVRGASVTVVYPGGAGEKAEMAVGDVIVAAGGSEVDSAATLTEILAKLEPGAELELELIDTAGPRLARVTLTKRNPDE